MQEDTLLNPNPTLYAVSDLHREDNWDENVKDEFDAMEIFDILFDCGVVSH